MIEEVIVTGITSDEDVLAAAVLHDTVEDTGTSVGEIRDLFGDRVALLVSDESEDKREGQRAEDTWEIRKQEAIDHIKKASRDARIITLGDKLSNMRAMRRDYKVMGELLWQRFNQHDPKKHEWYYRKIGEALREDFEDKLEFQEYMTLVDEVFVFPEES